MVMPANKPGPVTVLVTYRARKGQEDALLALVKKHWPTLDRLGLTTRNPPKIWRATRRDGGVSFVEMFEWKDAKAPEVAHQTPEVMAVWEPMGNIMEGYNGTQSPIAIAALEPLT